MIDANTLERPSQLLAQTQRAHKERLARIASAGEQFTRRLLEQQRRAECAATYERIQQAFAMHRAKRERKYPPIPTPTVPLPVVKIKTLPTTAEIQVAVARKFGVTKADLTGQSRKAVIVRPRQIAMFLAKDLAQQSFPEIGRRFGGRDHTTALYAVGKIRKAMQRNAEFANLVDSIRAALTR